ncbi:MAG: hypothetical protein HY923_08265 [Elusimicrobia bacterium]|nr:hypothetical protein [Elusimicrobiota bacterium]
MAQKQSIISEFTAFLKANKKWWLIPLVLAMIALIGLVYLGGTAAAPFVYTLF